MKIRGYLLVFSSVYICVTLQLTNAQPLHQQSLASIPGTALLPDKRFAFDIYAKATWIPPAFRRDASPANGFYPSAVYVNDSSIQYIHLTSPNSLNDSVLMKLRQNGSWENSALTVTEYAPGGSLILSCKNYSWFRNGWLITDIHSYLYNENSLMLEDKFQMMENDSMKNVYLREYIYYPDNDIKFIRVYGGDGSGWKESHQYSYIHKRDGDFHMAEETEKLWRNDSLIVTFRSTAKYQSKYCVSLLREKWNGRAFVPLQRWFNYYNCQWLQTGSLSETYADSLWEPYLTDEYIYTRSNKLMQYTASKYENTQWVFVSRLNNEYTSENFLSGNFEEAWQENDWVKTTGMKTEFDINGNAVSGRGFHWKDSIWVPGDAAIICDYNNGNSSDYYFGKNVHVDYSCILAAESAGTPVSEALLLTNYPNPFNPSTTIKYRLPNHGRVTIRVYTMLGALAATLIDEYQNAGEHETTFQAGHLSSGVYISVIRCGALTMQKKILLLK